MKLQQLQDAVRSLTPEQLAEFARWFEEHMSDMWDEQIERDIQAGRLNRLAEQAIDDFRAGRCLPLDEVLKRDT